MLNRHFLVTAKESAYLGIVKDDLQIRQRETKVNLLDLSILFSISNNADSLINIKNLRLYPLRNIASVC